MPDRPTNLPSNSLPDLLRSRQVHLDFHTSPHIDGIGADFDPDKFAQTLKDAHVDSVTVFARCHHGHLYWESKRHPERIHPHLARKNLLIEQIEACHRAGIRAPIYITIQWDQFTADRHRDWLCIDDKGTEYGTAPLNPGFYRFLDVFHPGYRQFLFDHVADVLESMPVDGLFFDIVQAKPSLAIHWKTAMDAAGLNVEDSNIRQRFAQTVIYEWEREMTAFVRERNWDCTIFYNSGHVGARHRPSVQLYSHYELESLPSGGWGYLHFPQAMHYARILGNDCLGMTGKFHTSWGDFGSYKNRAALEFECFHMLALGAKCSVGDQLPPCGMLDPATYKLIGQVYADVAVKEPFCTGIAPVVEAAIVTGEEFALQGSDAGSAERAQNSVLGALRMLQELRIQFDIVDTQALLDKYKVVILPDGIPVDDTFAAKIAAFVANGGKIIASHKSGLRPDGSGFAVESLGIEYVGAATYSPDFLVPQDELGKWLPNGEYVMYLAGTAVKPTGDTTVWATIHRSYFNRTWQHFCSHLHTPSAGVDAGYAGVVRTDTSVYFAHPIFAQYQENAPRWCKTLLEAALGALLGQRLVTVMNAPSSLIIALNYQMHENRYILHLLHYVPERRGVKFDIIEEVIPLHDLTVDVALANIDRVTLEPQGTQVAHTIEGERLRFTLPKLNGHALVVLHKAA